ncbi:CS1 type fimbrial major subunit [Yersinia aleksiciae]|uniref:CS1 type fimbrial major subunit n=1 Tax=Yersinia aleksiciae TaxID=263819 RepID=UPI00119D2672|nr:CS1 type fimbrial major subunit [Yersinia aleksiciae]
MMKKTLLSIMTVAALISSASVYSAVSNKTIQVEAEIPRMITITKSGGGVIRTLKLLPVENDATKYTASEDIKILDNSNNDPKVKISINRDFALTESVNQVKAFTGLEVKLEDTILTDAGAEFSLADVNTSVKLTITGESPVNGVSEERYTGDLKLTIESVA